MSDINKWNVVFLLDGNPPTKVMLLKRSPNKKFAPNFYTGTGGKVEESDNSVLDSAYRELQEETGVTEVQLTEIARVIVNHDKVLYYFEGIYPQHELPQSNEGTLEWVEVDKILEKEIIPDTKMMLTEWQKRNFSLENSFTLYLTEGELVNGVHMGEIESLQDGLVH